MDVLNVLSRFEIKETQTTEWVLKFQLRGEHRTFISKKQFTKNGISESD